MDTGQFPDELGGRRDLDYITPAGRRLTEYEAVTCYTQASVHGGGLQEPGDFLLRPDGRPMYDPASTALRCDDWFAFRDPSQMWHRPYYVVQSEAEKSIERVTQVALESGTIDALDRDWVTQGVLRGYGPFGHLEYGLFKALNPAVRESLSDLFNAALDFNAGDKLRHAQAISILGLDLETALGCNATVGRAEWLDGAAWQPVRHLIEEVIAITDWCETIVAVNLAVEPLLADPLRRVLFTMVAAHHGDFITPHIAGTATADWQRNAAWTQAFVTLMLDGPGTDGNEAILAEWVGAWADRVAPAAVGLFAHLEELVGEAALAERLTAAAKEEHERGLRWMPETAARLSRTTTSACR